MNALPKPPTKRSLLGQAWRKLWRDRSGLALVEFAYTLPILLVLGMTGLELSNLAIVNLRVSQAAMHIADNGSRIGDRDALNAQKIYESDINDIFLGVDIQAGAQTDLFENGRVIISSLEMNDDGGQWIHWQRCMGRLNVQSAYGVEGTGETGTDFAGMGEAGQELQATAGQAVIFVEIIYDYEPLIGNDYAMRFINSSRLTSTSAFNVRGTRDLSGIYQTSPAAPVRSCNQFTSS